LGSLGEKAAARQTPTLQFESRKISELRIQIFVCADPSEDDIGTSGSREAVVDPYFLRKDDDEQGRPPVVPHSEMEFRELIVRRGLEAAKVDQRNVALKVGGVYADPLSRLGPDLVTKPWERRRWPSLHKPRTFVTQKLRHGVKGELGDVQKRAFLAHQGRRRRAECSGTAMGVAASS
jgi:hypothetical protein